jgi:hypothetical protein
MLHDVGPVSFKELLLLLQEILNGGVDICKEAGIPLAGEHGTYMLAVNMLYVLVLSFQY